MSPRRAIFNPMSSTTPYQCQPNPMPFPFQQMGTQAPVLSQSPTIESKASYGLTTGLNRGLYQHRNTWLTAGNCHASCQSTVRKTKKPSVLDWAPRNDTFSRLMLFQVVCFWLESSHSFDPRHGVQLRISLRSEIPWWLQRKPKRWMPVVDDRRQD